MADQVIEQNFLEMSDEDILKMGAPTHVVTEKQDDTTPAAAGTTGDVDVDPDLENEEQDGDVDQTDPAKEQPAGEQDGDVAAGAADAAKDPAGEPGTKKEDDPKAATKPEDDKDKSKDPAKEEAAIDYKAAYERLTTPFKANGRDIAVKNVDDAITLMQMGANYNKKMAALKPNLKLMKLLENNGLLTEEKIGFLIDLDKKNPDAISKLVKDSGVDPMDLDADKASAYKQTAYTVDDREIELDTVLDEIQGTPTYNRTLEVVSTKWDAASKQTIASAPELLKVINAHMQNGIYDLISTEIESERVFGRLKGLSDIEAYRQVGDAIAARGGFNHLGQGSSPPQVKPAATQTVVTPPKPKVDDEKLKDKRRAASSTKPAAPSAAPKDFNPLGMSDEEFSKQVHSRFL